MHRGQLARVAEVMQEIADENDLPELSLLAVHLVALSLSLDPIHDAVVQNLEGIALDMTERAIQLQQAVNGTFTLSA